jgi:CHAT domain-containing protein/Tfp pilus assembly protein PilF
MARISAYIFLSLKKKILREKGNNLAATKSGTREFRIEVGREKDRLKISAYEHILGSESTLKHYEEISVSMERIGSRCYDMVKTLNKANQKGTITHEVLKKLQDIGQVFYDEIFTLNIKERIKNTKAQHLTVILDDQLVHIPWELLHEGQQFLCMRFNMGRLVRTKQQVAGNMARVLKRPLKMIVVSDPKGDLKGAYSEGIKIRNFMDQDKDLVNAYLQTDNVTPDFIRENLKNFDIAHFAGHADYNQKNPAKSGLRLTDGSFIAEDIIKMAGSAAMPALIFANACQSARDKEWLLSENFQDEIFGLANAFLLSGVKHYVGTFWEILDEPSSHFALAFYRNLLSGVSIGAALRRSRLELVKRYGEENIAWASYLLYGDPTSNYVNQINIIEAHEEQEPSRALSSGTELRAQEEAADLIDKEVPKKRWAWVATIATLVALVIFLWGYPGVLKKDMVKYEAEAFTYYNEGKFDKALGICEHIQDRKPQARFSYLIQGNVYLRKGEMSAAKKAYEKAIEAPKGTDLQKAEALTGLGRIASIRNQTDVALDYYQQATAADPANKTGYISQALLMDDKAQALSLLERAHMLSPQDKLIPAITKEIRKEDALARDQKKQDRINRLVKELLNRMESAPERLPSDGWTSSPLTMWIMDFTTQGYAVHEGEERLLLAGIADNIIQHSRTRLVERALFDTLLDELKLGSSKLIDPGASLSLGKILAARLILSGKVVYAGPQTQISMRLIETETGRITAARNESFGSAVPLSCMCDKLANSLLEALEKLYPLRGKILDVKNEELTLNIGGKAGVLLKDQFNVLAEGTTLEVISVQPDISLARIVEAKGPLTKGLRVELLSGSKYMYRKTGDIN